MFLQYIPSSGGVGAPGMQGSPGPAGLKGERGAPGELEAPRSAGTEGEKWSWAGLTFLVPNPTSHQVRAGIPG